MFYSVNSYSSASSRKGIGGLISGLDTDELVKNMTSGTRSKIADQLQKKQTALWKQTAYREATGVINSFKNKWFSSSSSTNNIFNSSFFNAKKITNSSQYVKVSGSTDAAKNLQIKDIKQLAETAGFTSSKQVSSQQILSGKISASWPKSEIGGESIRVSVGGSDYDITIGADFNFSVDDMGDPKKLLEAVTTELNRTIESSSALKGKIKFSVTADDKLKVESLDGSDIAVKQASEKLQGGLGLSGLPTGAGTSHVGGTTNTSSLYSTKSLTDALSGTTLTVSFNGIDKEIKFNASDTALYDDPTKLATYMQAQIDKAYGTGKVLVQEVSGHLGFRTAANNTFTFKSSDGENVLGANGALGISQGTTNRISWVQSIDALVKSGQFADYANMTPDADGNYKVKINDVEIVINKSETMRDLLNKINESDAGVRINYSTTSDTFTMTSKDSGANGKVNVQSTGDANDIGAFLFGTTAQQNHTIGQDAELEVSFDGGKTSTTIIRASNTFSLDGLNIELLGKAEDTKLVNLAGTSFAFEYEGISHTLTLPSDFKINDSLSDSDKVRALVAGLNTELGRAGLTSDLSFNLSGGKITFASTDPTKNITISGGNSSNTLLKAMGFSTVSGNGVPSITGQGNFEILETVKEDIKFQVENDMDGFTKKFKEFIDDYNNMIKHCNDKTTEKHDRDFTPLTEEQKEDMSEDEIKKWEAEAKKGILMNDRTLNTFMDNMRSALFAPVDGSSFHLNNMGISTTEWEENGQIHIINEDTFNKAISENSEQIIKMFTSVVDPEYPADATESEKKELDKKAALKSGLARRMEYYMDMAASASIGNEGTLVRVAGNKSEYKLSQDNLSAELRRYDSALSKLGKRLEAEEDRYYKQFTALEKYLSQMNSQSSWLTQQFGGTQ